MILAGENWGAWRKNLSNSLFIHTGLGVNPGLCTVKLVINCLSRGKAWGAPCLHLQGLTVKGPCMGWHNMKNTWLLIHDICYSCFLLAMRDDSIEGIYDTLKQCALVSKSAGGIGLHIHNIRATGSYIAGTNGTSNGIVPMLRVFNNTARYVDQGGNKVCNK